MSLSFASTGYATPAQGSTLVIAGMLATAICLLALSAAFGVGSPDASAMIIGS